MPLNEEAYTALLRLRRLCDDHFADTAYVFTHTSPQRFGQRVKSISKVFASAVKRAGIAHATPHALRHTAITEGVHAPGCQCGGYFTYRRTQGPSNHDGLYPYRGAKTACCGGETT